MTELRQAAACGLVAATVAGLALLDSAFGIGAVAGAAVGVFVLYLRTPREAPPAFRVIPLVSAKPTLDKSSDTPVLETPRPRYPGRLHLESHRYVKLGNDWEEEIMS